MEEWRGHKNRSRNANREVNPAVTEINFSPFLLAFISPSWKMFAEKGPRGLVGLCDNEANGGILLEIRLKESSSGR